MLRFQWNALRIHDAVLVHDPGGLRLPLTPGVVAMVDSRRRLNRVGIVVAAGDGGQDVLWPSHLAVHLDPRDPAVPCWRCERPAAAGPAV